MFSGKNKALTFSYDDGISQDIRLINILNKYNLKATFNLNSGLMGKQGTLDFNGIKLDLIRNKAEDIKHIYAGHEIAAHTLTHPNLTTLADDSDIIRQVEEDRLRLSELAGYEVKGFAYPGGEVNCDKRVADIIKNNTPIKYARTTDVTKSFEPYVDLFQYKPTLNNFWNWDILFETGKEFLELKTDTPKILYIWGHGYEFDIYPERWEIFEKFCEMMSGKSDIFYGTNIEILGKN